jgi:hypothetical protein
MRSLADSTVLLCTAGMNYFYEVPGNILALGALPDGCFGILLQDGRECTFRHLTAQTLSYPLKLHSVARCQYYNYFSGEFTSPR